ncbi:MAG: hypothetical protein ACM31E_10090 [Fibrobacterota bacterium]|nr:hypothetical protein [Chitinispirillaceae bacterium]
MGRTAEVLLYKVDNSRGGVAVQILLAVVTLGIIAGVMVFTLLKEREKQQVYHRKVIAIAEYGLMEALQKINGDPLWMGSGQKTDYDDGWYRIKVRPYTKSDTSFISIVSEAHVKSISDSQKCVLFRNVVDGDSVWVRKSP